MSMRGEIETYPPRAVSPVREVDLATIGRAMSRRPWWVLGPALGCFLAALAFVSFVEPRFTAESKVLVENGETYFTRPEKTEQQPAQLPDDEAVQSQVQLVSSRDIAREAIRRLELKGNPEFDPLAKGLNPITRLLVLLGLQRDPASIPAEDRILDTYYDRLTVFPVVKSRVITIEFTSTDPDLAARGANTIAELYMDAQSTAKRNAARAAASSLSTLIADLQQRASTAEVEADAFRSQSGLLVGTNNNTITAQQLGDLSTQLAQARTAEADSQAKANVIRDMIRQNRVSEIPDVANNELIRRIGEQRVSLKAELALQSRTLLPGHPRMQELTAQLADIDSQLRTAGEKAMRTLENDAKIAADRVTNLVAALNTQKKTASTAGADQVQLNALELKARLLKEQLEFNTAKYQEAVARENAASTPADARVISRAAPPQLPSFPKKIPILALATLAGLIASLGMLIAREFLSGRAFVTEAPEALVPRRLDSGVRVVEPEARSPAPPVPDAPLRAEPPVGDASLVALLDLVQARDAGARATRILVTAPPSAVDGSRAALALGRLVSGIARTILVDFNAGRPAVDKGSLTPITPDEDGDAPAGLSQLLEGKATFAEIIHRDRASRLHVVPVGAADLPDAADAGIDLVLDALRETYDVVITHAPAPGDPLTRQLARDADVAVLVPDTAARPEAASSVADLAGLGTARVFTIPADALRPATRVQDAA